MQYGANRVGSYLTNAQDPKKGSRSVDKFKTGKKKT